MFSNNLNITFRGARPSLSSYSIQIPQFAYLVEYRKYVKGEARSRLKSINTDSATNSPRDKR